MDDDRPSSRRSSTPVASTGGGAEIAGIQGGVELDVADRTGRVGPEDLAWLRTRISAAAGLLGRGGEVSVAVIDDAAMAAAHERFGGVTGTTDVLTFHHAQTGDGLDVELLVCLDEAARQAAARGHAVRDELLLYVVHGLLHCCGYDDVTEEDATRMHAEEDRLLTAVGVGAVFARPGRADAAPALGRTGP